MRICCASLLYLHNRKYKIAMATVKAFIRSAKSNKLANIRFRLSDGRNIQMFHKSEILIAPGDWDAKEQSVKKRIIYKESERVRINKAVNDRKALINEIYTKEVIKDGLKSEWLDKEIDKRLYPEKYKDVNKDSFFALFDDFLEKRKLSEVREKNYLVLRRALQRYELFIAAGKNKKFKLDIHKVTSDTLEDFESFLRNEHTLCKEYKDIYKQIPAIIGTTRKSKDPQPRGVTTINALFNKLRAFFNWCLNSEKTDNRPFKNYEGKQDVYGTPYYITIDERNEIHNIDLLERPELAVQRDIFVLQCLIGCRISDYYKMTCNSVINGAIEYIPRKTKDGRPVIVRVPLNNIAKEIIDKYKGIDETGRLMPFIAEQNYNKAIKEIFTIAEINRLVTVLNPTTKEEEKRPINEVASSHLARRTFVGNLYKKIKDPNLIGSLSGHKEGSTAFARYRDIDEEMKTELVKMLE